MVRRIYRRITSGYYTWPDLPAIVGSLLWLAAMFVLTRATVDRIVEYLGEETVREHAGASWGIPACLTMIALFYAAIGRTIQRDWGIGTCWDFVVVVLFTVPFAALMAAAMFGEYSASVPFVAYFGVFVTLAVYWYIVTALMAVVMGLIELVRRWRWPPWTMHFLSAV